MKILKSWLEDYVDLKELTAESLSNLLTTRVAEVDKLLPCFAEAKEAIVAEIKSVREHPERPGLTVATLSLGETKVEVVCGAPNCRAGMLSLYLPPGAKFFPASGECVTVAVREIGGILSTGVLVSEKEIGLAEDSKGIIELTEDYLRQWEPDCANSAGTQGGLAAGRSLADLINLEDAVIEIDNKSLTHRPDLWGHFGFARELSAILRKPLKLDLDLFADNAESGRQAIAALSPGSTPWRVEIAPGSEARRFMALEFADVKTTSSPLWLRRRLNAVGAGVRNLLVDLSNYVMHDTGQPNHTYDADLLTGTTINVRLAKEGEHFTALDGTNLCLSAEDIAITDGSGVVALGGVMGGASTAISEKTRRLLLEAANFDPVRVRKTVSRYAMRTDAANRFEKSLSAFAVPVAIQRYAQLLKQCLPSVQIIGGVADCLAQMPPEISVPVRPSYIRQRLGEEISDAQILATLQAMRFTVIKQGEQGVHFAVPYFRATRDISIEDDFVEEIGRIWGYENIPVASPQISSVAAPLRPLAEFERTIREALSAQGFSEVYHYSTMNRQEAEQLGYDTSAIVALENPVDAEQEVVRNTLVPGLLAALQRNAKHFEQFGLFEMGRVYQSRQGREHEQLKLRMAVKNPAAHERRLLGMLYVSGRQELELAQCLQPEHAQGADFYALLGVIRRLVSKVTGAPLHVVPLEAGEEARDALNWRALRNWMHPYRAASLAVNQRAFGSIAQVHPQYCEQVSGAVLAELDLELLLEVDSRERRFAPISKFPVSFFEMSVVMPVRSHYQELECLIASGVERELLRGLEVLSVYAGPPLAQDQKSVSVRLALGAQDRTLSGTELTEIQQGLMRRVNSSENFSLRE